ncbi:MAG: recombination-associated protein RdgC [Burkholderiaceae bacterium]|nr:recombination-associated protein RdgC [Burkholderiaceae bacterium]
MFRNALVYRIAQWDPPSLAQINDRLDAERFAECGAAQTESAGWIEPRGERHAALAEAFAGRLILKLCRETKAVPASVVRSLLDERLDAIEQQDGRRPRGRRAREIKDEIVHELLPRAFAKRRTMLVWVDPGARWVVLDSANAKQADAVLTRLVQVLGGGLRLAPLQTALAPATAMALWLRERDAPAGFSIDRDCELKQADRDKACVRYARHTLDIDEIAAHIAAGKLPTRLALTFDSRVSFVLTETLALKSIRLLDVVLEASDDKGFDADVALATGELARLFAALIETLGGEDAAAQPAPAEPLAA